MALYITVITLHIYHLRRPTIHRLEGMPELWQKHNFLFFRSEFHPYFGPLPLHASFLILSPSPSAHRYSFHRPNSPESG